MQLLMLSQDVLVFCGGDNATAFAWTLLVDLNLSHNSISSLGDALVRFMYTEQHYEQHS